MPEMRPVIPQMSMDLHHPLQVSRDIPTFSVSTQHQSEVKISGSWVSNRTVSVGHTAQLLHLRGKGWRLFANDAEVDGWLVKHQNSHRTNGNAIEVPFNCIYGKIVYHWRSGALNKVFITLNKWSSLKGHTDIVMVPHLQRHQQTRDAAGQVSLLGKPINSAQFPFVSLFKH